jgi:hypothetical protein
MWTRLQAVTVGLGVVVVTAAPAAQTPRAATPPARSAAAAAAGITGIESATRLMLRGRRASADVAMRAALARWAAASTRAIAPPAGSLEADVLAIRDVVFQPLGNPLLRGDWSAEGWPTAMPGSLIAPARLDVTLAGSTQPVSIDVARQPPGLATVVFAGDADRDRLSRLVARLGGVDRREPAGVMEVPNQPAGAAERIIGWWNGFFPARPGHWEGVDVESAPAFHAIEFTDAARSRARVPVRIGYAGATVIVEKIDGAWRMRELTDQWVM